MSNIIGDKLKSLREEKHIPQRLLASLLNIDTATYCKIEKGGRRIRREQILLVADYLQVDKKQLLQLWSADRIFDIIADEEDATQILNVVSSNILGYEH
ncbi:helix-turn-helix domain-containing protein [Mucilaginibacter sp. SMC90]|uniref:helix-turn-helix domain-containing protein n=1 Tax=Mucilaginibacter sp. SMC90 TaxID=2929803 RepID=UPI001FB3912A|nr:helix-turn-helix transcriptional regulator [Mucilaginibacter sp. SMC90]UOE51322.1 helix-turn-helix domain-containing protein [Mucilaginibacter sp. SMC90]